MPAVDTLLLADLHLGRVRQSRVELPIGAAQESQDRLQRHLAEFEPARVVLVGDLLHAFDRLPAAVSRAVQELQETVEAAGAELAVVEGNHDGLLDQIPGIDPEPFVRLDERTVVSHGHERPPAAAERYVIGHDHPAITIEGDRRPCFLACSNQRDGAAVLVLPAFSRVAPGTPVNGLDSEDVMSPLLTDLDSCRPIVPTDGEALTFPPLSDLRPHL
jgi:putative SbcD/Mre11-related phosphoesterase